MPKRRANGEGSMYKRQDGLWVAQYTDIHGKKRYLYGHRQQDVKAKLKEAIRLNDDGIVIDPKKISFAGWVNEWLEVYHKPFVRPSTYGADYSRWRIHIEPYFRDIQLKDIRLDVLQKFLNEKLTKRLDGKEGGYSRSVCTQLKMLIKCALEKAVDLQYIPHNPADKVKVLLPESKEKDVLSVDNQQQFEAAVMREIETDHNSFIYLVMLRLGLRIGEALGLQESDIDFDKRELHVRRSLHFPTYKSETNTFYVGPPKTSAGMRIIPLAEDMVELFRKHIETRAEYLAVMIEYSGTSEYVDAGYLFITRNGNVLMARNAFAKLQKILKSISAPHVSPHGLRHTFATRWVEAGLDIRTLAEILGHADVKMTLNTYSHALPEQKRRSMDMFSETFKCDSG